MEASFLWKITFFLVSIFLFLSIVIEISIIHYIYQPNYNLFFDSIITLTRQILKEIIKTIETF